METGLTGSISQPAVGGRSTPCNPSVVGQPLAEFVGSPLTRCTGSVFYGQPITFAFQ